MRQLSEATLILGMGGNLDGEAAVVERMRKVAEVLAGWGQVRASSVYRTAPLGPAQPDFLNAALRVTLASPAWQPVELMTTVLEVEALLGRARRAEERWGPRKIDLDVLLWGPRRARYEGPPVLEVPHPRLASRRFALQPMADVVDEETEVPGTSRTVRQLLDGVKDQAVTLTEWTLLG
jgi:2-amino-4-hydroxy-6-hydroxymethyldihydropteridine diphosphokinase